jgi:UDP-N-acetylmuramoyl-L-alanyl-D-glutamate--2,6-diaminopimelate ligase
MEIRELIDHLPVRLISGSDRTRIELIVEDSRRAAPGSLFVARSGMRMDGRRFIGDAVQRGAVAILTDDVEALPQGVVGLVCDDVAETSAHIIERFHGNPSRKLTLIGITGTNGKTTTSYLIHQLLNGAGIRCGLIGTVQVDDGAPGGLTPSNLTTPPAIELSRMLGTMVDHGCKACVMEASSHALHQQRAAGLHFTIGVFTNLTGDHLDYHQTMDAYFDAKAMLFEALVSDGTAIINMDDPAGASMATRTKAKVLSCSLSDASSTCHARIGRQSLNSIEARFTGPWGTFEIPLPLVGAHNVINALQACAVCHALGLDVRAIKSGMSVCQAPPGRLEPITGPRDPYAVLVDYAHTDDALDNVLRGLKPIVPRGGKLRVIFGCGGDRDRTKRPRMARVACRWADEVIITSDNPRTEDPQAIIDETRAGVPPAHDDATMCMVDRETAIRTAIDRLGDGDILLIAGKGHEDYQIIGTTKRPFDDRKIAAAALAGRTQLKAAIA